MNNLPLKPNEGGVCGEAGGVCIGVQGSPPATFSAEDAMAQSIVRISRELEEAQAQIAVYEAERTILASELRQLRDEVAKYRANQITDEDDYVQLTAKGRALLEGRR